jgi:hypothetical protein
MPQYDFRTLSPIDFESLLRDLLQEDLGITLESFKAGRDSGIDFRYCYDNERRLIVQCKHYVESGYDALYRVLSSQELPKVQRLRPDRYILVTSVGLSPSQKDRIVQLFSPHLRSSTDVLGKNDINNLLGRHPRIERLTLKLWLLSLPILQEVLHSRIHNFSKFEIDRIREHAKLYVQNQSLEEAIRILETHNFCIIAGIPGIGKTILAEMLVLHYSRSGYDLVKVSEDISEAWGLVQSDRNTVFYYDDFLGQTSLPEKLHKNEDVRLINFIRTVRRSSGAKLILTTREYILKQAQQQYERFDREDFKGQKCIIDLAMYTRLDRARILYNHIYFSGLPESYRGALLNNRNYLQIIDHKNYSPRIVQAMTEFAIHDVDPSQYVPFFLESLRNPLAIWDHAFRNHLSQASRNLLVVLATMPSPVLLSDLENAFHSYNSEYAKLYHHVIGPQDFRSALKELEGDFLILTKQDQDFLVQYQNPSVADFLKAYLRTSPQEIHALATSIVYYEQFTELWDWRDAGRNVLRRFFTTDPESAVLLMRNLLASDACRLITYVYFGGQRKKKGPVPIEERAADVAWLVADSFTIFFPLLVETVQELGRRLSNGIGDREGVAELIKETVRMAERDEEWLVNFSRIGIRFLMTTPTWPSELSPLCGLFERHPELFSSEDRETIKDLISNVADNVLFNHSEFDGDSLREEAEALESIATVAGLDIDHRIDAIRDHSYENDYRGQGGGGRLEYASTEFSSYVADSDDDIASLFSTLPVTQ